MASANPLLKEGPDGLRSWAVAVAGLYISTVSFGLMWCHGVLYVATMVVYGVSREQASWPYTVFFSLFYLAGPVSGLIGSHFDLRRVVMTGGTIASAGLFLCFFSEDLMWVTTCFGVISGVGTGLMFRMVPPIVHHYFEQYRSTSMGVVMAGASIGGFVFPGIAEAFFNTYGFRGTFLLLSGFMLNALVAGTLMRTPPWFDRGGTSNHQSPRSSTFTKLQLFENGTVHLDAAKVMDSSGANPAPGGAALRVDPLLQRSQYASEIAGAKLPREFLKSACTPTVQISITPTPHNCNSKDGPPKANPFLSNFRTAGLILKSPMFHVISVSFLATYFSFSVYCTVIIDFAIDRGVVQSDAKYIIFSYTLSELLGSLGLGLVTDKGLMTRKNFFMLSLVLLAVTTACQPLGTNFVGLVALALMYGLIISGCSIMIPLLQADYLGRENFNLSYGLTSAWLAVLTFIIPTVIGPVSGVLSKRYGLRAVLIGGPLLSTFGFVMCYIRSGIMWITVFYGLLAGVGNGGVFHMMLPVVNQRFHKYRSTAMGIVFSGGSIGAILLPGLMETLVEIYGFQGGLLLIGGFMTNVTVAAFVLKSPPWPNREGLPSRPLPTTDVTRVQRQADGDERENDISGVQTTGSNPLLPGDPGETVVVVRVSSAPRAKKSHLRTVMRPVVEVLRSPMFHVITACYTSVYFAVLVVSVILIDFALDQGVSASDAKYLLAALSVGDIAGKLALGWITDGRYLSRRMFVIVSMQLGSASLLGFPFGRQFTALTAVCTVAGLVHSQLGAMFPLLQADYLGASNHALSTGLMSSWNVAIPFVLPRLIAYFRDVHGSYAHLFYLICGLMTSTSLTLLLEPCIVRSSGGTPPEVG